MDEKLSNSHVAPQIVTLLYHSINTPVTDPWGICVSTHHFEQHVQYLKARFDIIDLADLTSQLQSGNIVDNGLCLTFDDGYADNYLNAIPILEKYNCPATFFISTTFIGEHKPFWWDELELIFLCCETLPVYLLLQVNGCCYSFTIIENDLSPEQLLLHASWKWHQEAPTSRCAVFLNIWKILRPLSNDEIKRQMTDIRVWAGTIHSTKTHRLPMSKDQLRLLSKHKLFTVGLHTHTHIDLEEAQEHIQLEEIVTCREILNDNYGIKSNSLAYPYGRFNSKTIELVKYLGLATCFTTQPAAITARADKAMLGRTQVFNGDVANLKCQLGI